MKLKREEVLPLVGKPVKIVKGFRHPFVLDGIVVDVLEDSIIFKTNTCTSIIGFGTISEIRGV